MQTSSENPWRAIATFLVVTFALSSVFYALIVETGKASPAYVTGLMWCPGLGAVFTCLLLQRKLASLGWSWSPRYQLLGYLIPLAYCIVATFGIWLTGYGGFPNMNFVHTIAEQLGWQGLPTWLIIVLFIPLQGTVAMVLEVATALGEEIGWRGFLVPELSKVISFAGTALVSGLIWAAWHYPITPTVYAGWVTPTWYWMTCFTIVAVAISFVLAWLRLKSGSVWPCVFLHASHNLFMQSVFTPLTSDTGMTVYVAGDLGAAFVIVAVIVGFIFWRKRLELQPVLV